MKIGPYKHKERYISWKEKCKDRIPEISEKNSEIILRYLNDMELGLNVSATNQKGSRSFIRLNTLKTRLIFLIRQLEKRYGLIDLTKTTEFQLHDHFSGMRNGTIKKQDSSAYKSVVDFVKIFKAFWHWYQKVNGKNGIEVKILIIEDSAFERNLIIKLLNKAGYKNVTQVAYGEEGIEKFKKEKPDLVLLDLILPTIQGKDVLKVLKRLKKLNSRTKIIIVTVVTLEERGQKGETTLSEVMRLGAVEWILKPIIKERLIPAVKNAFK